MEKDEKQILESKSVAAAEQKLLESIIQETVKMVLKEFLPELEPTHDYEKYFQPKQKGALSHYRFRKIKPPTTLLTVPRIASTRRGRYKKAAEQVPLTGDEQQLEYQKNNVKVALRQLSSNPVVQRLLSGKRVSKENVYSLSNFLIDNGWINIPKSQYKRLAQILAMINFEAGHAR